MDDRELTELRKVVGLHEKLVYEAIKRGRVVELPDEGQFYARTLQEHLHLKHVHAVESVSSQTCVKECNTRSPCKAKQ